MDITGPLPYIRTYRATIANNINNQLEMIEGVRSTGGWTDNYSNYLVVKDMGTRKNRLIIRARLLGEQNESFFLGRTSDGNKLSDIIRIYSSIPLVQEANLVNNFNETDLTGTSSTNHRDKKMTRTGGTATLSPTISSASLTGYTFKINQYGTVYTFQYVKTNSASEVLYKIVRIQKPNGVYLGLSYDNYGGLTTVSDNRGNTLYFDREYRDSDPTKSLITKITLNRSDEKSSALAWSHNNFYNGYIKDNETFMQEAEYTYNSDRWLDFRSNTWKNIYTIASVRSTLNRNESYTYIKGGLDIFRSRMSATDPNGVSYTSTNYQVPILKSVQNGSKYYSDDPVSTKQVWNYAIFAPSLPFLYLTETYQPLKSDETQKANYYKYNKISGSSSEKTSNTTHQLELMGYAGEHVYSPMTYSVSSDTTRANVTYSFSGYPCATYNGVPVQAMSVNAVYGYTEHVIDARGYKTAFGYDIIGRITSITEAVGTDKQRITTYEYTTLDGGTTANPYNIPNKIIAPGLTVTNIISGAGWVTQQTISSDQANSTNKITKYSYYTDSTKPNFGLIKTIDGPRADINDTQSFTYDAKGNLSTESVVVNGITRTTTYSSYNDAGLPKTIAYPNGTTKTYEYGISNKVKKEKLTNTADSTELNSTSFLYNVQGYPHTVSNPDSNSNYYDYDLLGRVVKTTLPEGGVVKKTYHPNGTVAADELYDSSASTIIKASYQTTDTNGRVFKDQLGTNPDWYWKTHSYDANGNLEQTQTYHGIIEKWTYDVLNRIKTHTDGEGNIDTKDYDLQDNVILAQDALGAGSNPLTYRNGKLLAKEVNSDFGTKTYNYNEANQRTSSTYGDRLCNYLNIDSIARVQRINCIKSSGSTDETAVYDDTYQYDVSRYGRLDKVDSSSKYGVATEYGYDAYDRIILKKQYSYAIKTWNGKATALSNSYGYSTGGKLTSFTLPSGRQVSYTYDLGVTGRLTGITLDGSSLIRKVGYNAGGQMTGWYWGKSGSANYTWTYDSSENGNIKKITNKNTASLVTYSLQYNYNHDGLIEGLVRNTGINDSFTYDGVGRLKKESRVNGSSSVYGITYTYDKNGNRTSLTANGDHQQPNAEVSYSYTGNKLTSAAGKDYMPVMYIDYTDNAVLYNIFDKKPTYDNAGRRIWDTPTLVVPGYPTIRNYMVYNHKNERAIATFEDGKWGANAIQYIYDEDSHLVGEYDSTGKALVEYIWLDDKPIAALYAAGTGTAYKLYYIVSDAQNTPRRLIDAVNDTTVWFWDSTAFGLGKPTGDITFNLRFPGQYYDWQNPNQFYNHNRYYNPALGRYMEADPIGLEGGLNPYVYAANDPVSNVDPSGLIIPALMYATGVIVTIDGLMDGEPPAAKGAKAVDVVATGFQKTALSQGVKQGMSDMAKAKSHGNKLNGKSAEGYTLRDRNTGDIQKYGETTRGEDKFGLGRQKRYSQKYLMVNDLNYRKETSGTKQEMHQWQHEKILEYKGQNGGQRPPLNKSDY